MRTIKRLAPYRVAIAGCIGLVIMGVIAAKVTRWTRPNVDQYSTEELIEELMELEQMLPHDCPLIIERIVCLRMRRVYDEYASRTDGILARLNEFSTPGPEANWTVPMLDVEQLQAQTTSKQTTRATQTQPAAFAWRIKAAGEPMMNEYNWVESAVR